MNLNIVFIVNLIIYLLTTIKHTIVKLDYKIFIYNIIYNNI